MRLSEDSACPMGMRASGAAIAAVPAGTTVNQGKTTMRDAHRRPGNTRRIGVRAAPGMPVVRLAPAPRGPRGAGFAKGIEVFAAKARERSRGGPLRERGIGAGRVPHPESDDSGFACGPAGSAARVEWSNREGVRT
jgi:hypothetical protein